MWRVVQANAGLVTEYEVLQLLRQRGLRTPEEEAEAAEQRAAVAAGEAADEGDLAAAAPEALYPQMNPPFAVERAVRGATQGAQRRKPWRPRPRRACMTAALSPRRRTQVFERLSRGPAAKQDPEKLAQFVSLVTARARPRPHAQRATRSLAPTPSTRTRACARLTRVLRRRRARADEH